MSPPRGESKSKVKVEGTIDFREQNNAPRLDEETRIYLKRLRRANPDAKVTLPEGFYDTDDEEEERKRQMVAKKWSSRHIIDKNTSSDSDEDGSLKKQKRVVKVRSSKMSKGFET